MAAATAAGVTACHAGLVTINLSNNYISASGGNHLNADLTGDGHPDLTITNAFNSLYRATSNGHPQNYFTHFSARVNLNGVIAAAREFDHGGPQTGSERLGSRATSFYRMGSLFYGTYQLTGPIPLFFKDLRINGGAPTEGLLQVTVSALIGRDNYFGSAEVQLDSFTYNSNNPVQGGSITVPDQGSTLALLAMGAGGVLALRR
jgi:VPDSG-CTERM motif